MCVSVCTHTVCESGCVYGHVCAPVHGAVFLCVFLYIHGCECPHIEYRRMWVCVSVCGCISVCVYASVSARMRVSVHVSMCLSASMSTCVSACVHVCVPGSLGVWDPGSHTGPGTRGLMTWEGAGGPLVPSLCNLTELALGTFWRRDGKSSPSEDGHSPVTVRLRVVAAGQAHPPGWVGCPCIRPCPHLRGRPPPPASPRGPGNGGPSPQRLGFPICAVGTLNGHLMGTETTPEERGQQPGRQQLWSLLSLALTAAVTGSCLLCAGTLALRPRLPLSSTRPGDFGNPLPGLPPSRALNTGTQEDVYEAIGLSQRLPPADSDRKRAGRQWPCR